jgi:dipeptide/tripeptide permease
MVVIALISIGLGRGCFDANTAPILAQILEPELCSSAYGILNCVGCFIAGLTTLAGGWMRQHVSFPLIFAGAGLTLVGGVACLLLLARHSRRVSTPVAG